MNANTVLAILLLVFSLFVVAVLLILRGRKGPRPTVRPLPAFQDLRGEIGHAAEGGGTIHVALGNGGLGGDDAVTSLAVVEALEALADNLVLYNAPPVITVGDPTLLPLAQDVLRRAYARHGLARRYETEHIAERVRFIAPSPIAYAAGAANVAAAESVTANAMLGAFGSEVSLVAAAGAQRDLPQLAAAAAPDAIGALYPATDRLAVGEELYTGGAQLSSDRRYAASLVAEDIVRIALVLSMVGAVLLSLIGFRY